MVNQAIETVTRQFEDAFSRGDAAGLAAIYADDAKLMMPDTPMITGKQAIQEYWQGMVNAGVRKVSLKALNVDDLGDTAVETGVSTAEIPLEGGKTATMTGKYVVIWKLQSDGSWKYDVDIYNADAPMGSQ